MRERGLAADRRGVTSLEYALVGCLVFMAIIAGVQALTGQVNQIYTTFSAAICAVM